MKLNDDTWALIFPYLEQAQDISDLELAAWLARLTKERPDVGGPLGEVLADRVEARNFLNDTAHISSFESSRVDQRVGAYTIDSLLGKGGMGEVWLARRSDGRFQGSFAVKFLDSQSNTAAASERFLREGRLLARLTHSNIARLIDAGVTSGDQPYLVLEYVKGKAIDRHCDAYALGLRPRVQLFLQVLAAVAHAHANLIVHRDIKPSNVLVTPDGTVKLLDFGISKLIGDELAPEDQSEATQIDGIALTPDFAAPEQVLGEPPSTATDVYQLGVLLHLLLAGRLPLSHGKKTRAERVQTALKEISTRASDAAPAEAVKALRGDLDAIIGKALRKRPDERYATAAALATDLQHYLNNEPVEARAGAAAYRAKKFIRRYRGAVFGTGIALAALTATTIFALVQLREARVQRDQSRALQNSAQAENQFLIQIMSTVSSDGRPVTPVQILEKGMALLEGQHSGDAQFKSIMYVRMAYRFGDLDDHEREYAALMKAESIAKQVGDTPLLAEIECAAVDSQVVMQNAEEAKRRLQLGKDILAHLSSPTAIQAAHCLEAQGAVAAMSGNIPAAIKLKQRALALLDSAGEAHDMFYLVLLSNIGYYYNESGDAIKAFDFAQRQVTELERGGWGDSQNSLIAHHNVATGLYYFGEVQSATSEEEKDIARARAADGDAEIDPTLTSSYGISQLRIGQPAAALQTFDAALMVAQRKHDARIEGVIHSDLADAFLALGRLPEARAELDQVRRLARGYERANRRALLNVQHIEARLLLAEGRAVEARRQIEALLQFLRQTPSDTYHIAGALITASRIAVAEDRFDDARSMANEALTMYEKLARRPESSADVGEALLALAKAQLGSGQRQAASESARRAALSLIAGLGTTHPLTQAANALAVRTK